MNPPNDESNEPSFWHRPAGTVLVTVAIIAGFFFLRERWGHVLGYWPYLLLLACLRAYPQRQELGGTT